MLIARQAVGAVGVQAPEVASCLQVRAAVEAKSVEKNRLGPWVGGEIDRLASIGSLEVHVTREGCAVGLHRVEVHAPRHELLMANLRRLCNDNGDIFSTQQSQRRITYSHVRTDFC